MTSTKQDDNNDYADEIKRDAERAAAAGLKLYMVTVEVRVRIAVLARDVDNAEDLACQNFLEEERSQNPRRRMTTKVVKSFDDIPTEWIDAEPYAPDDFEDIRMVQHYAPGYADGD